MWDNLFGVGKLPSPEEFITVLSMNVGKKKKWDKKAYFLKNSLIIQCGKIVCVRFLQ